MLCIFLNFVTCMIFCFYSELHGKRERERENRVRDERGKKREINSLSGVEGVVYKKNIRHKRSKVQLKREGGVGETKQEIGKYSPRREK